MSHSRAVLLMILVTLLWSIAGVLIRQLDSASSFELTFWRSVFNGLALFIALRMIRGPGLWRRIMYSPRVVWMSGFCWSIMFTTFMVAITMTTVANVLIVMALMPLITALFSRLFLQHRLSMVTWIAIGVAFTGIVWMFIDGRGTTFSLLGSLVALSIPLAAACNFTILQHVGFKKEIRPLSSEGEPAHDMMLALLIGAILSALATLPLSWPFQSSLHDLGLLSLLGVFQLALPCLILVRVSRELSAPEITLLQPLEVIFGVTWAWLWAGEHLSLNTLCGGLLVLGALMTNELARIYRQRKYNNVEQHSL